MIQLRPDEGDRAKLKSPLGQLLEGSPTETLPRLSKIIARIRPPRITTVGDVVSRETLGSELVVNLRIVDNHVMRKQIPNAKFKTPNTYRVRNPPGVITTEAWVTIKQAMKHDEALILVDGEEDLLALPAIVESPDNALVIYGQPSEGLVVVVATGSKKTELRELMDLMPREEVD